MASVFLAGAAGAIGRRLVPLLRAAGYSVHGTTRDPARARDLARAGVHAVVVDVYDAAAVAAAMAQAAAEIVVHQLTDLPQVRGVDLPADVRARNARVRVDGTAHLVAGALACGARRIVAQSIAWAYAPGPEPHREDDPLDAAQDAVATLERLVLHAPPLRGTVLRYGSFYGPGTWYAEPAGNVAVHVDAAARATLLAIERDATGIFNVAEPSAYASSAKARDQLGWRP